MTGRQEVVVKIVVTLIIAGLISALVRQWTGGNEAVILAEAATARAEATQVLADRAIERTSELRDSLVVVDSIAAVDRAVSEAEIARLSREASRASSSARDLADRLNALIPEEAQPVLAEHLRQDSIFEATTTALIVEKDSIIADQDTRISARDALVGQLESTLVLSIQEADDWEVSSIKWEIAAKPPLIKRALRSLPWIGAGVALSLLIR